MTNLFALYRFPLVVALTLGLAACGGDGDGGGDNFTPTLPRDAVTITAANADIIASSAVESIDSMDSTTEFKGAERRPSLIEWSQLLVRQVVRRQGLAGRTESRNCGTTSADGQIVFEFEQNGNQAEGELRFINCRFFGITFDGTINFDGTFNRTSGDFSAAFNGSFSISADAQPTFTMVFDSVESGNDFSGDYTLDCSLSISGADLNFLLETTEPLIGNVGGGIDNGMVIVYGANNTRLRMDIVSNIANIDIDEGSGTFEDFDVVNLDSL